MGLDLLRAARKTYDGGNGGSADTPRVYGL
jgi:hypothetical protein